jgi:HEAT repeat protein
VERLREQLSARDAADRVGAALALRTSDLDPGVYLQALIEGMRPQNYRGLGMSRRRWRCGHVRRAAIEALAGLGERARPALPALYYVLDGRGGPVRRAARAALARLE